jgi:hypothetical protein
MNNNVNKIVNSKGRFFGLTTGDGRVMNAQFRGETPSYIKVWDRNANNEVKLAKTNIVKVTL